MLSSTEHRELRILKATGAALESLRAFQAASARYSALRKPDAAVCIDVVFGPKGEFVDSKTPDWVSDRGWYDRVDIPNANRPVHVLRSLRGATMLAASVLRHLVTGRSPMVSAQPCKRSPLRCTSETREPNLVGAIVAARRALLMHPERPARAGPRP